MKNFKRVAVISILVGCIAWGNTLAYASDNAYRNLKKAFFNTLSAKNRTISADLSINRDGSEVVSMENIWQLDGDNRYFGSQTQLNDQGYYRERSETAKCILSRFENRYTQYTDKKYDNHSSELLNTDSSSLALTEMLIDALFGNAATQFTSNNSTVSANLKGSQVPEMLNTAVSAMIEKYAVIQKLSGRSAYTERDLYYDLFKSLSITKNAQVESIALEATLKDGYLDESDISLYITGKDSRGKTHRVAVNIHISITDIGITTVNTIDTAGVTVRDATIDDFFRFP